MSLFPPEMMQTIVFPLMSSFITSSAAIDAAPAGSAIIPCLEYISINVSEIKPSSTPTNLSTYLRAVSNVLSPTFCTAIPSANLSISSNLTGCPLSKAARILRAPEASTPTTSISGATSLM